MAEQTDETVERAARAIARAADADYWVEEIARWEGQEQWERDAHPEERPISSYEDREEFRAQARAALAAAGALAARGDAATPTEVEWGVRLPTGRIREMPDEEAARRESASLNAVYARETGVVQRTVSAWREVTP